MIESKNDFCFGKKYLGKIVMNKASVTIVADFSPEFNPPFRRRSKH